MARVAGAVALLYVGLAVACAGTTVGGEDEGEGIASGGKKPATSPPGSATKKCEAYVKTWCNKSFGCFVKEGRLEQGSLKSNVDQCIKLVVGKLPCSGVTSVSASYDQCLADVKAMSCSKFDVPPEKFLTVPQPPSCDEVVAF